MDAHQKLAIEHDKEKKEKKNNMRSSVFKKNQIDGEKDLHIDTVHTDDNVDVYYEKFTFDTTLLENASPIRSFIHNKILIAKWFQYLTILLLLLDISVLAADNYKLSEEGLANLERVDFAITWIFFIEIILRFVIFRPKKFFSNYFDILDLIIILLNVGMLIWNYIHNIDNFYSLYENAAAIKCLKMLRVFRFLVGMVVWKRGAILFMEMISSLKGTKEFVLFSLMVMVLFMLIGRELFAYRVTFVNFDQIPENL